MNNNNQDGANPISSSSSDDERYGSASSSGDAGDLDRRSTSNYESETSIGESDSKPPALPEYQDFSHLSPIGPDGRELAAQRSEGGSINREPTFPGKLHAILASPQYNDIISWLPHGRSWRILKYRELESTILPIYFRHSNYSSFARQISGWGFRRISTGSDYNSYYHPLFLRGLPHLSNRMKRLSKDIPKRSKDTSTSTPPDFYAFSRAHPLPAAVPPAEMQINQHPVPEAVRQRRSPQNKSSEIAVLEHRKGEILRRLKDSLERNTNPEHRAAILAAIGESERAEKGASNFQNSSQYANHGSLNHSTDQNDEPTGRADVTRMIHFVSSLQELTDTFALSGGSSNGQMSEAALISILQQLLSVADRLPNGLETLLEIVRFLAQQKQPEPSATSADSSYNAAYHQPPPLQQQQQPFNQNQSQMSWMGPESQVGDLANDHASQLAALLRLLSGPGTSSQYSNHLHANGTHQSYGQPLANPSAAASVSSGQSLNNGESEALRQALISMLQQQTKPPHG